MWLLLKMANMINGELSYPELKLDTTFLVCKSLISNGKLGQGQHHFDVEVALPGACPSSIETNVGKVNYRCIVKLDSEQIKTSTCQLFTVMGQTRDFLFTQPTSGSERAGKGIISIKLDKGAYVPGEIIHCTIDASDDKLSISKVKTQLKQIITFSWVDVVIYRDRAENELKSKTKEIEVAKEKFKPNVANIGLHLETTIALPSSCISSFEESQNKNSVHPITVKYMMMVTLYVGTWLPSKIKLTVPFLVGSNVAPQRGREEGSPHEYCQPANNEEAEFYGYYGVNHELSQQPDQGIANIVDSF